MMNHRECDWHDTMACVKAVEALPRTMLAARLHGWRRPLRIDEIPLPEMGEEDVLLRSVRSAITSSTVRMVSAKALGMGRVEDRVYPYVIAGHAVGHVVELGKAARGFDLGDRVVVVSQTGCKVCANCRADREYICLRRFRPEEGADPASIRAPRQGGMSEYVKAHYRELVKIPDGVPFADACEVGPLAGAYRMLKRSMLRPGESIMVSGATGNYGLKAVLVSLAMGAGLVIALGRNAARLASIKGLAPGRIETVVTSGADLEERVRSYTDGWGAHRLVDYLSDSPDVTSRAIRALRPGGRAVLGGEGGRLDLTYNFVQQYGLEITASSASTYYDYPEVLELLRRGLLSLEGVDLRAFAPEQINEAIDLMAERPGSRLFWCHTVFSSEA